MQETHEPKPASGARRLSPRTIALVIPQLLLFGGMAVMLIAHPNAVRSGIKSERAVLVNAVLLGGWLLLSFVVLPRVLRNAYARAAVLTAIAIGAILVLVVPTLRDTTVIEEFPAAVAEPSAPTTVGSGPPATTAEPVRVSSGTLRGIDHDATGRATIYRQPDGRHVVGLEDIDIEPGPDYRVVVVRGTDRRSPDDGIELDGLRGNQGTQYYEVPRGHAVGDGWTVLIWCRAFGVPVANATQQTVTT